MIFLMVNGLAQESGSRQTIHTLVVYMGGYIFKHFLDVMTSLSIKWRRRPEMTTAVD